jgi:hypothetical protein
MSLADVVYALEELAEGRIPAADRALRGLNALDPYLLQGGREQDLHDAASLLELLVATGGTASMLTEARSRAAAMAAAVRRLIAHG